MKSFKFLSRLLANEKGNVLLIGAATLPLLIGSAAIGVDTIQLSLAKRQLQRAADSGALAGGYALIQSKDVDASVTRDLQLNNAVALQGAPVIQNAPATGAYAGDPKAVRVVLSAQRSLPFTSFFTSSPTTITAEATAAIVYLGKFCMVSLEEGNTAGITFQGSTTVNLGCGMATNSKAAEAVVAGGSSTVTANPVAAVGGLVTSGNYVSPTRLLPYSPPQDDPFDHLPLPAPTSCQPKLSLSPHTIEEISPNSSGVYCYKGMDIKGTLTLAPGTYYIDGSTFDVGSQGKVVGQGVTIILTSQNATSNPSSIAEIKLNAGAVLDLTAPKSGTYEGVLFYQDPRAPLGGESKINGHADSKVEGAFYFPRHDLTFNGSAGMQTKCLQIVARRLHFSGNSNVQNECPTDGGAKAFDATFVKLVG